MVIIFKTKKLEKICNDEKLMLKTLGNIRTKALKKRLIELNSANSLGDIRSLPQARCHELKGNLKGCFSVDLDGPYRLIFEPVTNPIPRKDDGGIDWGQITVIRIINIKDTHE